MILDADYADYAEVFYLGVDYADIDSIKKSALICEISV